jgi:hypothetical protein
MWRLGSKPQAVNASPGEDTAGASRQAGWWETYRQILRDPVLARHFFIICLGQAVFQGGEQVIVSVRGSALAANGGGVALLQMAASLGLLLGFVVLWLLPRLLRDRLSRIGSAVVIGLGGFVLSTQTDSLGWVLAAFLAMTAVYELLDLNSTSLFFQASPAAHTARYGLATTVLSGTCMSVAVLAYGLLIDALGFSAGSLALLALCVAVIVAASLVLYFPTRRASNA